MGNTEKYCTYCMSKDLTSGEIDETYSYDDIMALNPFKVKTKKEGLARRLTEKSRNCMWVYIQDKELRVATLDIDNVIAKKKIKYCPICGRKL